MAMQLTLSIEEHSAARIMIENIAATHGLSHEQAALRIIEKSAQDSPMQNTHSLLGAFRHESDLVDESLEIASEERARRNAQPPSP